MDGVYGEPISRLCRIARLFGTNILCERRQNILEAGPLFKVASGIVEWYVFGLVGIAVLAVAYLFHRSLRIVPQQHVGIVERLGKYSRTLNAGFHFLIPFVDKIRKVQDLKMQQAEVPSQMVITKDNVQIKIDTIFFYTVIDAKTATYTIHNFVHGVQNITAANIRQVVGKMDLDETLAARERISSELRTSLDEATEQWGVRIDRVEVIDIHPPIEIHNAMEKQMRAEREKRAAVLQAEGERQAAILKAEGEKQAAILKAEAQKQASIRIAEGNQLSQELDAKGQAAAIRVVAEAEKTKIELIAEAERMRIQAIAEAEKARIEKIKSADMDTPFLTYKTLEALAEMANGNSSTIFVPTETVNLISSVASLGKITENIKSPGIVVEENS